MRFANVYYTDSALNISRCAVDLITFSLFWFIRVCVLRFSLVVVVIVYALRCSLETVGSETARAFTCVFYKLLRIFF